MFKKNIFVMMLLSFAMICGCKSNEYVELELPLGMFYSDLNYGEEFEKICEAVEHSDEGEEVSEYYVIDGEAGQIILYDEFLYCEEQSEDAIKEYYEDDSNYEWFVEFDRDDEYVRFPINISEDEKNAIYALDLAKKEKTLYLNEVTDMATLMKVSKDNVVCSKINLVYYDGIWNWQTEIIDDNQMKDDYYAEYVHSLPKSVSDRIDEF